MEIKGQSKYPTPGSGISVNETNKVCFRTLPSPKYLQLYVTFILGYINNILTHFLCFVVIPLEPSSQINDHRNSPQIFYWDAPNMVTYATQTLYSYEFSIFYPVLFLCFVDQHMWSN